MKTGNFRSPLKESSGWSSYIDLLEVVGMLFVLGYHLSNYSYKFLEDPRIITAVQHYLRTVKVCCVPIFLLCNGYLLFRHDLDLKKHLKKTLRFAVAGLFWGVVTLWAYNHVSGVAYGGWDFLWDMLTWRGAVIHLWYIGQLVVIYLCFPVLKAAYDKDRRLLLYAAAFLADLEEILDCDLIEVKQSARALNDPTVDFQLGVKAGLIEYLS